MAAETLEKRIEALEKGAAYDATQAAIRQREAEMLETLRGIREQMAKEGSSGASSKQVASLQEENEALKAKLVKQEYRIRHLISGMEELLAAKK